MILSFQETFVPAVVAGTKPHTIRRGKNWREGMSIQFYQNPRQKSMKKFRGDGMAKGVQDIVVRMPSPRVDPHSPRGTSMSNDTVRWLARQDQPMVIVDGRQLTPLECQELSRRDGFEDYDGLLQFISNLYGLPFEGQLIHWTDLRY